MEIFRSALEDELLNHNKKSHVGAKPIDVVLMFKILILRGAIVTIVDQKTGFLFMEKLKAGKQALPLSKTVVRMLVAYKDVVKTITSDNGKEFAEYEYIAKKLDAEFYFADPYCSWQRELNEYTNRLIRQYIPKGSNFDADYIRLVQNKINREPRQKLNFETPSEKFYASLN